MTRDESIAQGMSSIQQGQMDALGVSFDNGAASGSGGFSQSDIDKAVAQAQALDAQALTDAQTKAASDLAAVQASLDAMTEKEGIEEKAVANVNNSVEQLQASLDAIKALLAPLPPAP